MPELIRYLNHKYPHLKIFARSSDVRHSFLLRDEKVEAHRRESYDSSIALATEVMCSLGFSKYQAFRSARSFRFHDIIIMNELYKIYRENKSQRHYIDQARRFWEQLEKMLMTEKENPIHEADSAWDVETLREKIREMYTKTDQK